VVIAAARELHPAYFALVMSTGVVSVAAQRMGFSVIPEALFWLNVVFFVVLAGLTIARTVMFPDRMLADLSDHGRAMGFFTLVAALAVIGIQLTVVREQLMLAKTLWWAALVAWFFCTYSVFTALVIREVKPTLAEGINGGWLLAVVATQSLAVLGCRIAPTFSADRELVLFAMLALWAVGGMLYIWTISLIFYRYTLFRLEPSDLMPPYWINMGAMAISALAGALLIGNATSSPLLESMLPFLRGFTVLFWATATWWIPMLVVLGLWRHAVRRYPLRYDPLYWGLVFPVAMYTSSTLELSRALGLPFLASISRVFIWLAFGAWSATFAGLVAHLVKAAARVRSLR